LDKSTLFIFPWLEKEDQCLKEVPLAVSGNYIPPKVSDGSMWCDTYHEKLVMWDNKKKDWEIVHSSNI